MHPILLETLFQELPLELICSHVLEPAFLLPDILYIQVGTGSAGAPANTGAASGALSYVSVLPSTTAINVVMQSGNTAADGGGGGTSSLAGTAGTAGTAWTYTNSPIALTGLVTSLPGQNGAAGGATSSAGGSITPTLPVSGGAGGGGITNTLFGKNKGFSGGIGRVGKAFSRGGMAGGGKAMGRFMK